ncbi:MAG: HAMP domain-containing sensor histidine kinase [bacterium]|nr:HAMP domain-containing sensor histidine kinase [bacterium]
MKESILSLGNRHVTDMRDINRSLSEKALNMRCQAYMSQVKAELLTATIYGINHSKQTLRRELKEKSQLERELRTANRTKDRLLSIIAHDLRTPFANLVGLSQTLSENFEGLSEADRREFLDLLHRSAMGAMELVDNLLEWTKSQSKNLTPQKSPLRLFNLVREVNYFFSELALRKGLELKNEIDEAEEILADPNMLQATMRNLISNAIKFTPSGSVTISANRQGSDLLIEVRDTGRGMSPELLEQIFDSESLNSRPGTDQEMGAGLGLFLIKGFCEAQGGHIWAQSSEGKGSTFTVSLPQT